MHTLIKPQLRPSRRVRVSLLAIALSIGAGLSTSAWADGDAADQQQSQASNDQLQEVVVTAQRRPENLQQVPIAATALSTEALAEQGIATIQDLQKGVPGLSIQPPVSSETFINIRGIGLQQTNPASSNGVAFYVDGQYIPSLIDAVDSFYDLGGVEVLRGPQGTLLGANSDGGAIFVNSAQPTLDSVKGYLQQTIGSYNDYREEGAINVPLSSSVAVRLAAVRETRDSFSTDVGAGASRTTQPGNVDFAALRLQLLYKPSEDFQATFRFEPYESRTDGYADKPDMGSIAKSNPGYDPYAASIQNQPFTLDYNTASHWMINGERSSANLLWNVLDGVQLKSVTSYQAGHEADQDDIDASSSAGNFLETRKAEFRTITQELDLISTSDSPLQWSAGLYYLNSRDPLRLSFIDPPPNQSLSLNLVAEHINYGAFGSVTYKITPDWSITAGLRESHDRQPFDEQGCSGFPQTCGNFAQTDYELNYSAKLSWQATAGTLAYFSASSGYKAGGINLQIPDIGFTPPPFPPEKSKLYELGVKTSLLDKHLRFDADVFDSEYSHYQLQEFLEGLPNTQGPGDARILGAEAQVNAKFGGFGADLSASYLHGTVSQTFPYTLNTGGAAEIQSGTIIPYAPEWILNAGVEYRFSLPHGLLTPRVQYQFQDQQFITIYHSALPGPDQVIPEHGTVDLSLTYTAEDNWSVETYATNLFNRTYIAGVQQNPQPAANWLVYAPPLQVGARLRYDF